MKVDVLLGLQWGDEGKGKIVDVLTLNYGVVCRFQGGPNAGHTICCDGQQHILRQVPSGILRKGTLNIISSGVVVDPILLWDELIDLNEKGVSLSNLNNLVISDKAHLILPTHRYLDAAYEQSKGDGKVGTTGKGIGPAYTDKARRIGLRIGDARSENFLDKYRNLVQSHRNEMKALNYTFSEQEFMEIEKEWLSKLDLLTNNFHIENTEYLINEQLKKGKRVLAEGAQGTMLDINFGSYPFVTSSNTTSGGVCTGLGIGPDKIDDRYGIFKAYCTRVGGGPFPTELFDEKGEEIGRRGKEFGAVTGRPRRCGWIDLVALRYAIMINGINKLIMMKSDVLDTFDEIKACIAYRINGRITDHLPFDLETEEVEPIYESLKGWGTDLTGMTSEAEFPKEFQRYILFLEKQLGVPITIVSVGPDRNSTIVR